MINPRPTQKAAPVQDDRKDAIRTLYMESLQLVERLHRRLLDVIKDEFDRNGRSDINAIQALLLFNIGNAELTAGELRSRGYYLGSNVSYNLKKLVDLGFYEKGEGWKAVEAGDTALGGRIPINTSGGLKSFGHPIGASGVRMIYECVTQLRGECGERQVKNARLGMAHNVGGPGAVACVVILGNA